MENNDQSHKLPVRKKRRVRKKQFTTSGATQLETNLSKKDLKVIHTLLITFSLFASIAVGYFIVDRRGNNPTNIATAAKLYRDPVEVIIKKEILRSKETQNAKEVLNNFLIAKSASEASFWIHNRSTELRAFKKHFQKLPPITQIDTTSAYEYADGIQSVFFNIRGEDVMREMHVIAHKGEAYKVDWRSCYLCGTTPLAKYVKECPPTTESVFGYLSASNYYTKDKPERDYKSLQISGYNGEDKVYCFIKRRSEAALKLYTGFQNTNLEKHNTPIIRTHLEISLLDGTPLITAEIRNVISTDWLEHTL